MPAPFCLVMKENFNQLADRMGLFDLFFGAGPAITKIMTLGFMPKNEDFLELTPEQYEKFYEQEGYTEEKVYALLPKNPKHFVESDFNELNICTESDIATLKRGWQIVENYCKESGFTFTTDQQKLMYAATKLPDVFSRDTPFDQSKRGNLTIASYNPEIDND